MVNGPESRVELSFVVPVFNGAATIGSVVEQIHDHYQSTSYEIVLVNDGSSDDSERACLALADTHRDTVTFVNLSRNFGEHNAVLAGLNHASGDYVAILDDDGQQPPQEVKRMLEQIRANGYDVLYGRYRVKHHNWFRNLGSWFTDRVANLTLNKPRSLYLSSFKVINRFTVDRIIAYRGAFPFIDGLIFRVTHNVGQIDVEHRPRVESKSNYTLVRLVRLWLNMFLQYSIVPLRMSVMVGLFTIAVSAVMIAAIIIDRIWINPTVTVGIPTVLMVVVFFAGVQLLILGVIGEYLGRLLLDFSGTPQFVVRYTRGRGCAAAAPAG